MKDREVIASEDVGSLEEELGPNDPVFQPGLKTWIAGYETALRKYAWWKDGVQYVGTCETTLEQALKDIEK